jgi:RNA polymerase sigma-70 factor (ECF subfamily)
VDADRQRIADMFGLHSVALRRYVARRVSSDVDPDDVVAEVFAVAWRRLRKVPPEPETRPYLFAIARHIVLNAERSARRRRRLVQAIDAAAPDSTETDDGAAERVREAIAQLKSRDREALVLVLWDGLSHAEAARVLGCSTGALTTRLARARAELRRRLSDLTDSPGTTSDLRSQR